MNYLIPIFKDQDEAGICFTCCVSGEYLNESELYYDNMSQEYFNPILIDKYLDRVGVKGIERENLK